MKLLKLLSLALLSPVIISLMSCREAGNETPKFEMTAEITSLGDRLTVEVISDEYNSGTFIVLYSDETVISSSDGAQISPSELAVGDTVVISYGGQVMMSLPPQIVAKSITKQ